MSGAPASQPEVRVTHDDQIATIWLDRPTKRNAMTYAMWRSLRDVCVALSADSSVRVVVVRGTGGHFCAGADIGELHAPRAAGEPSFMEMNMAAESALAALPKPTIAMIEGDCIGGGCAIAMDCDIRLAQSNARFGITPARLGVVYPPASVERAVDVLGPAGAKFLLFTGELIDVDRAERLGLLAEVCPDTESLESRVSTLAHEMAARSSLTQAAAKSMISAIVRTGGVPADLAQRWADEAAQSGESTEGAAAFAERRPPVFRWGPDGETQMS
jgi:enoyl-CoA hydratase/carnithine racemase